MHVALVNLPFRVEGFLFQVSALFRICVVIPNNWGDELLGYPPADRLNKFLVGMTSWSGVKCGRVVFGSAR